MSALPVWLLVTLGTIPVLWLAYCILKAQFGLACGRACTATILATDAVAVVWLLWKGPEILNGAQLGFAFLCLFTVNTGLGVGWLTGHLSRKRAREGEAAKSRTSTA